MRSATSPGTRRLDPMRRLALCAALCLLSCDNVDDGDRDEVSIDNARGGPGESQPRGGVPSQSSGGSNGGTPANDAGANDGTGDAGLVNDSGPGGPSPPPDGSTPIGNSPFGNTTDAGGPTLPVPPGTSTLPPGSTPPPSDTQPPGSGGTATTPGDNFGGTGGIGGTGSDFGGTGGTGFGTPTGSVFAE